MAVKYSTTKKWSNKFLTSFFAIVLLLLVWPEPIPATEEGKDFTLKPGAGGLYVVDAVIGKLQENCLFDFDNGLLHKLAHLRSDNGMNYTVGTGGIWQYWRLTGSTQDLTSIPGEGGIYVVDAVYQRLKSTCAFDIDRNYMNRTAYDRTAYGTSYSAGTGGIWQVTEDQLLAVNMECSTTLRSSCLEARGQFGIDLSVTKMEDLDKPLISGMVMAFFVTSKNRINEAGIAEQLKFSSESLNLQGEDFFELSAELRLCPAAQLDVTFIIDGSGSVRENNFFLIVNFLREMIGDMDTQPDNVRVSVIVLDTNATLVMGIDDFKDDTNLEAAFQRIRFKGGLTNTAEAIDLAVSVASNSSSHKRINKAAKVFVLVGDLKSENITDAVSAAMRAKEMDFEIFVLGVGNSVVGQLKAFASEPTCKHLSLLDSYYELYLSVNQLQKGLCEAPAAVNLLENDSVNFDFNTLPADENSTKIQVLKLKVPETEPSKKYIGSKHIAVKVKTMCGHVNMYASYDISKPNQGYHAYSAVATDLASGELFANSSFDGRPLYVTLESKNANESCIYSHYNITIVNEIAVQNPCKNRKELYFPHPRRNMFIQCDLWGEAFEMTCPPHTIWDQNALTCVKFFGMGPTVPESKPKPSEPPKKGPKSSLPATLRIRPTPTTTGQNSTASTNSPKANSTTIKTTTITTTAAPTTSTTAGKTFENPCTAKALAEGKYFHPHPEPQKYIHCDQSGNYRVQRCSPGLIWVQSILTCNFALFKT